MLHSLKFIRLLRVVFSSQQRRYWGSNNDSKWSDEIQARCFNLSKFIVKPFFVFWVKQNVPSSYLFSLRYWFQWFWARSIQPKFQSVRRGKEDHLKRWTRFSKLFRLDRTDPLSFGPKFPESLVEWIAPFIYHRSETRLSLGKLRDGPLEKLWGSGDFLSRRNLFFVIKFLVWFFLSRSMNIF